MGNGVRTQFKKGHPAFRRGEDLIPRGTVKLLCATVRDLDAKDMHRLLAARRRGQVMSFREEAVASLAEGIRDPRRAPLVLEFVRDPAEGRPRPLDERPPIAHVTVMWDARDGPPPGFDTNGKYVGPGFRAGKPGSSPENGGKSAGDRAALPPAREIPRDAGTVVPPRQADGSIRV